MLFVPVVFWTASDVTGIKLSKNTEDAIKLWTFFAASIVGLNYISGPSVPQISKRKEEKELKDENE